MRFRLGKLALFVLCLSLTCLVVFCAVPQLVAKKKDAAAADASEQKRAVHALNRRERFPTMRWNRAWLPYGRCA